MKATGTSSMRGMAHKVWRFLLSSKIRLFVYLFVLFIVTMVGYDWYRAYRQRVAIERLRAKGVTVDGRYIPGATWSQFLAGRAPLFRLSPSLRYRVSTARSQLSKREFLDLIPHLRACSGLSVMEPADDDMVRSLCWLKKLEGLSLVRSSVTDEGLSYLTSLPLLHRLSLVGTRITTAGLKKLSRLPSLRWLDLSDVTISDWDALADFESLHFLRIKSSTLDDEGLRQLAHGMKQRGAKRFGTLRLDVHLAGAPITDEGLKALATIGTLMSLRIDGTEITEAGLLELAKAPMLRNIVIWNGKLTREGVEKLAKARPKLHVGFNGKQVQAP